MSEPKNYLAVDVGEKRVGLAIASVIAKLPRPLAILPNQEDIFQRISKIVKDENIDKIIVGLPRNMSGEETAQSDFSRQFAAKLGETTGADIIFADESLSSERVKDSTYKKDPSGYLDSIAACFILEEYLETSN
ncbi:MAG TPA: Holliday junction resolvase RuvX [Candidatus Saccharimonadales bacterium]|nr:Holliday junction resolvase RuvX [Candidatus Saccharimonadales bacterium]